ncbi:TetR/AcrR family transcriptional regulator [Tomitella biformata]|uniref:TetR/AcrR family transcriptional regulator n=1 Tax=Tomitella biformata TaxID=630403 RepID=UPI0004654C17|nr:TetR/AcrR family transcriptional regulator [Tomitella biformata]
MNSMNSPEIDPRRVRSRSRLLDAAASLLSAGGVEAVTIEAVTRASKVARTTLYRHFPDNTQLITAAFERLVPKIDGPLTEGTVRERFIQLIDHMAASVEDAPLQLTTLGWLALGSTRPGEPGPADATHSLRTRVINQYREPADALFNDPAVRAELGDFDNNLAIAQLAGPIVFARLAVLPAITQAQRHQIVDDFLAARSARPAAD